MVCYRRTKWKKKKKRAQAPATSRSGSTYLLLDLIGCWQPAYRCITATYSLYVRLCVACDTYTGSVDRSEVDRHRESVDVDLKSEMEPRREDFPEQHVCENEFSPDQQLWNPEENSGLEQEEPEPPQVKEEQEELCISQEGEQLVVKLEADAFIVSLPCEENQQSEAEPSSEQLLSHSSAGTEIQDEEGGQHVDSGSTKEEEPKPKKRRLKTRSHHKEQHVCENEITVQHLCKQENQSSLDQEEQEPQQIKVEQEELEPLQIQEEEKEPKPVQIKEEEEAPKPLQIKEEDEAPELLQIKDKAPEPLQIKEEEMEPEPLQIKEAPDPLQIKEEEKEPETLQIKMEHEELEPLQFKEEEEAPESVQIKEEQEKVWTSQEVEQFMQKQETDIFMVTSISIKNEHREPEPNSDQLLCLTSAITENQDEEGSRHVDSGSAESEELKMKKRRLKTRIHHEDVLQLHDCKEEEVLTVQQHCNQERNSSLDQEEQDAAQVKDEEEALCTSQEEGHFGLKQETDTFMVTSADEENDNSETEPNSEQLLSHNFPDAESQDQGAFENVNPGSSKHEVPKSKKRLHRNISDCNNVHNSFISENQCDTDTVLDLGDFDKLHTRAILVHNLGMDGQSILSTLEGGDTFGDVVRLMSGYFRTPENIIMRHVQFRHDEDWHAASAMLVNCEILHEVLPPVTPPLCPSQ
ncbi:uncharacterized protein KZ484_000028 [Pholidichthys leucotaenia]